LSFNSYSRENSTLNKFKFQSQEHVDDLGLNWDSFKWRNHQPEIGRFFGIDKLAEKYYYNSTYAFSENKLISYRELEGLEANLAISALNQDILKNKNAIAPNVPMNGTRQPSMGSRLLGGAAAAARAMGGPWIALGNSIDGMAPKNGGGYTLSSSSGTTSSSSQEGVRQGQSSGDLEVGHLMGPMNRSVKNPVANLLIESTGLVEQTESQTHAIEKGLDGLESASSRGNIKVDTLGDIFHWNSLPQDSTSDIYGRVKVGDDTLTIYKYSTNNFTGKKVVRNPEPMINK
jgi:hypothetical protein